MDVKMEVENVVQVKSEVEKLEAQGYSRDQIYIFSHGASLESEIADKFNTEEVGMKEQGFMDTMKNVFAKRGDELRSEFEALGLTLEEAEQYEQVLDEGKLVIIAKK